MQGGIIPLTTSPCEHPYKGRYPSHPRSCRYGYKSSAPPASAQCVLQCMCACNTCMLQCKCAHTACSEHQQCAAVLCCHPVICALAAWVTRHRKAGTQAMRAKVRLPTRLARLAGHVQLWPTRCKRARNVSTLLCAEHIAHKLTGKAGRRKGGGGADPRAGVGGHRPGGGLAHRRGLVRCEWRLCCVNADVAVRNVLLSAGLGMGSCVHGAERAREGSWRAARGRVGCVLAPRTVGVPE